MILDGTSNEGQSSDDRSGYGTCFGYEVHSSLPFVSLRSGRGDPLEVTEQASEPPDRDGDPLLHWFDEAGKVVAEIYSIEGTYDVWINEVGWFRVDPSVPSVVAPPPVSEPRREARLWGSPTVLCFLHRGDLPLHAAAVEVDGAALILAAPGRYGKTTLAGAFVREGFRLLTEDVACCRTDASPTLFPGPAMLRIRRDVYERLDFPGTDVVGEDPERVYLTVPEATRGDGDPVPIRGVVFLRRSEDEFTLDRVPMEKAVPDLWALSLNLPTDESRARCFHQVTSIAAQVPVWNVHRRLSLDLLPQLVGRIVSECMP